MVICQEYSNLNHLYGETELEAQWVTSSKLHHSDPATSFVRAESVRVSWEGLTAIAGRCTQPDQFVYSTCYSCHTVS